MASFNGDVVSGGSQVLVEVSPDIHICGVCKQQYNNFEVFFAHKQNGCHIPSSDTSATSAVPTVTDSGAEFVFEETYQACVARGVRKVQTKAPKMPVKKLKPALTAKRRSCCFTGCSFKTQYGQKDMERHLKTHTGEKPFECEVCHKRFSRRDKLNMHSRSHTGEKPHKCKYCAYAAADSSSLKKHLRIHYDERPFKCQICPYASRNSSQLTVHLRSHTGDAPFQCHQCEAKFKINSDLKRHIRIHSGEKPYQCEFCDYRCAMKGNLKSHVQIRHSKADSFRCGQCDFRCGSKMALRQHSRDHQPAQPIKCGKCSYSCSSKGALKIHERIHSEERPFKCEACGFATKQRSNLVIHRKKFHSEGAEKGGGAGKASRGEEAPKPLSSRYRARLEAARAFCCDVCGASFVREDSLRSHRKQHRDPPLSLLQAAHPGPPTDPRAPQPPQLSAYIVGHPLAQDGTFVPAAVDVPRARGEPVVLGPTAADMLVQAPMIQQVSLLTPVQHVLPHAEVSEALESQAVLLTHLGPGPGDPLHQALLQSAAVGGHDSASTQAFITACSDLDGLNALIQEGGTEVTVVTEGNAAVGVASSVAASTASQDLTKQVPGDSAPGADAGLVVPNLSISSQGVIIHSLPVVVSAPPQVSPQGMYPDAHALDIPSRSDSPA